MRSGGDTFGYGPTYLRVWLLGGGLVAAVLSLLQIRSGEIAGQQAAVILILGCPLLLVAWAGTGFRVAAFIWPFLLFVPAVLFDPALLIFAAAAWASVLTRRPPADRSLWLGIGAGLLAAGFSVVAVTRATPSPPAMLVVCLSPTGHPDTNAVFETTQKTYPLTQTTRVVAQVVMVGDREVTVTFDDYATTAQADHLAEALRRDVPGIQEIRRDDTSCDG